MSSFRDWTALTTSGVVVAVLGLLWTLSASRLLPPAEYADFTAAASLVYFIALAAGPLSQTIAYFAATGTAVRAAERTIVLWCIVAAAAFAALAPFIAQLLHFRSARPLFVVAACVVILPFGAVRRGSIQGLGRFSLYAWSVSLEAILRLVLLLLATLFARDAASSLFTYAIAAALALLFLPVPRSGGEIDVRAIFRYFVRAFPAAAIYAAFLYSDIVLVKLFFGAEQAALYGASSFVAKGVGMLVAPIYVYAVPQLAAAVTPAEVRRRFANICLGFLALEAFALAALFVLRRPVVAILVGPRYAGAADLVLPIGIAVAIGGFTFIATQLPAARARFDFVPWYAAGYLIELVAVSVWHETLMQVVTAIIGAQLVTLALVAPKIARALRVSSRDREA